MNIDFSKYLKNKDIALTNDDLDLAKLKKDLYSGYTKNEDVPDLKDYVEKSKFDELQSKYTTLDTNYQSTVKTLDTTNDKIKTITFDNKMIKRGFSEDNFDDIRALRNSKSYAEMDDDKALDEIKTRYSSTYIKTESKYTPAPNETKMNENPKKPIDVKFSRNTSLRDLLIK